MRARLEGGSRREAREQAEFYRRGRKVSTNATYGTEYRRLVRLVRFCELIGKPICCLEGIEVSFIICRSKKGVLKTQLKKGLAVITMLSEVGEFESSSKSPMVNKVKLAVIKDVNKGRKKMSRIVMTREMIMKIVKVCYHKDYMRIKPQRRRFMIMIMF